MLQQDRHMQFTTYSVETVSNNGSKKSGFKVYLMNKGSGQPKGNMLDTITALQL